MKTIEITLRASGSVEDGAAEWLKQKHEELLSALKEMGLTDAKGAYQERDRG